MNSKTESRWGDTDLEALLPAGIPGGRTILHLSGLLSRNYN